MRRVPAIALLIAFFAPSAVPAFAALTANPEANLPACCRSHGAHHCAMKHWMLAQMDSGAPKLTPAPCPMYPAAAVAPQLATFVLFAAPRLSAELVGGSAPLAAASQDVSLIAVSPQLTRGPPVVLA